MNTPAPTYTVPVPQKSEPVVWLLWLFTGAFGGHRYYLRSPLIGVLMTLTLGGFGFWALADAFFIPRRLRAVNATMAAPYLTPAAPPAGIAA